MNPKVGSQVHYRRWPCGDKPAVCRAAQVTEVATDVDGMTSVGLCVTNPDGHHFRQRVAFGYPSEGGTWHWPDNNGVCG